MSLYIVDFDYSCISSGKIEFQHRESKENHDLDNLESQIRQIHIKGTTILIEATPADLGTSSRQRHFQVQHESLELVSSLKDLAPLLHTSYDVLALRTLEGDSIEEGVYPDSLQEWINSFKHSARLIGPLQGVFEQDDLLKKHAQEAAVLLARVMNPHFAQTAENGSEIKTAHLTLIKEKKDVFLIFPKGTPALGEGGIKKVIPAVRVTTEGNKLNCQFVALGKTREQIPLLASNYSALQKAKIRGMVPIIGSGIYISQKRSKLADATPETNSKFFVVMEYCTDGDLASALEAGKISETQKLKVAKKLIQMVSNFHTAGFAHRDIKLMNVLMDEGQLYFGDVDFTCRLDEEKVQRTGTFEYAAPEIRPLIHLGGSTQTSPEALKAIDYWALGISLCELFLQTYPALPDSCTTVQETQEAMKIVVSAFFEEHQEKMAAIHPHLQTVLQGLLELEAEKRALPNLDIVLKPL